jgi:hypothetical protein
VKVLQSLQDNRDTSAPGCLAGRARKAALRQASMFLTTSSVVDVRKQVRLAPMFEVLVNVAGSPGGRSARSVNYHIHSLLHLERNARFNREQSLQCQVKEKGRERGGLLQEDRKSFELNRTDDVGMWPPHREYFRAGKHRASKHHSATVRPDPRQSPKQCIFWACRYPIRAYLWEIGDWV